MSLDLSVEVEGPNGRAEQGVKLVGGNRQYYEEVKLASGFARRQFVQRAAEHFRVKSADLGELDDLLVESALKGATGGREIEYPVLTFAELAEKEFDREYLVPSILAAQQPCILGGPLKAMKTSVALDLALSLATGGRFLGYFHCERAVRTAFMSGESSPAIVQETLLRIADAAGIDPSGVSNLLITDRLPTFGHLDHCDAMRRFLRDNELEVVFIDAAYLCVPGGDGGNVMLMGELLRSMGEVFSECGATSILIHHFRSTRPSPFAPPDLNDISWAGFREHAAQWILLCRRRAFEPGSGRHELWLASGGRAGHSGLWGPNIDEGEYQPGVDRTWQVSVLSPDEARSEATDCDEEGREVEREARQQKQLERDQRRICEILARFPGGETKNILRGFCGMSGQRFNVALAGLLESDDVEPCEILKPGRRTPHDAYRLGEQ